MGESRTDGHDVDEGDTKRDDDSPYRHVSWIGLDADARECERHDCPNVSHDGATE